MPNLWMNCKNVNCLCNDPSFFIYLNYVYANAMFIFRVWWVCLCCAGHICFVSPSTVMTWFRLTLASIHRVHHFAPDAVWHGLPWKPMEALSRYHPYSFVNRKQPPSNAVSPFKGRVTRWLLSKIGHNWPQSGHNWLSICKLFRV